MVSRLGTSATRVPSALKVSRSIRFASGSASRVAGGAIKTGAENRKTVGYRSRPKIATAEYYR